MCVCGGGGWGRGGGGSGAQGGGEEGKDGYILLISPSEWTPQNRPLLLLTCNVQERESRGVGGDAQGTERQTQRPQRRGGGVGERQRQRDTQRYTESDRREVYTG